MKARDKALSCDQSSKWIHIKFKSINDLDNEDLEIRDRYWYCKECIQEILPF